MPLDFSVIENFTSDYRDTMRDKTLLRYDRYNILKILKDKLQALLSNYEALETGITSGLLNSIKQATAYEELSKYHEQAADRIKDFFLEEQTVPDVHDLFRIIRDAITIRVLQLVENEMKDSGFGGPPADYVWIGLGSEGRDEQTMLTDQDNMIIYGTGSGNTGADKVEGYFEEFSKRAVERLDIAGFQKCKGGVMPSGEKWRGSVIDWKKRLQERITYDKGIFESLDMIILTDARPMTGNKKLLDELMAYFFRYLNDSKNIMKDFIQSAVLMPTAIGFFGNFKVEKSGDYKDMFNIKLLGWAPLILSVRMLAIWNGIYETNTLRRIRLLRENNVIKRDMETDLTDAYLAFVKFRIMNQIRKTGNSNITDSNYVRPDMLGPDEQDKIRKGMKSVEALQKYIEQVLLFGQPI